MMIYFLVIQLFTIRLTIIRSYSALANSVVQEDDYKTCLSCFETHVISG